MPKGRFLKLKEIICNIPIKVANIANVLPRGANSNGLIVVKLKLKSSYHGHAYFKTVCSASLYQALVFLKQNNALHKDVDAVVENVPRDLLDFSEYEDSQELDNSSDSTEEIENLLHSYSFNS